MPLGFPLFVNTAFPFFPFPSKNKSVLFSNSFEREFFALHGRQTPPSFSPPIQRVRGLLLSEQRGRLSIPLWRWKTFSPPLSVERKILSRKRGRPFFLLPDVRNPLLSRTERANDPSINFPCLVRRRRSCRFPTSRPIPPSGTSLLAGELLPGGVAEASFFSVVVSTPDAPFSLPRLNLTREIFHHVAFGCPRFFLPILPVARRRSTPLFFFCLGMPRGHSLGTKKIGIEPSCASSPFSPA